MNVRMVETSPELLTSALHLRLALALDLRATHFPTSSRILKAPLLFFCFGGHLRHGAVSSMPVDCDERQVGGTHMSPFARYVTFYRDLYARLQRCVEGAINGRLQDHQVAYVHRNKKIEVIDRGGHHV